MKESADEMWEELLEWEKGLLWNLPALPVVEMRKIGPERIGHALFQLLWSNLATHLAVHCG